MAFWIIHIGIAITLSLLVVTFCYLLKIPIYYGLLITTGLIVSQFIDLDHFQGDTNQLAKGVIATSQNEYNNIYGFPIDRPLHNRFIYITFSILGLGFWIGWSLHLLFDNII